MTNDSARGPIRDARILAVIERLQAERRRPQGGGPLGSPASAATRTTMRSTGFPSSPEQGDLIYLLCRGLRATRVVEFATSIGMSTLYFAAAMRDNGGGTVIGSELVPAKVAAARRNLARPASLGYAELREGEGRGLLRDLGGPVDFVLLDGRPLDERPSLARQVFEIVAPQLRIGGYVMNDNAEPDFLEMVRDPASGFLCVTLPLKGGTELRVKVA